jgi:hypothetical protein
MAQFATVSLVPSKTHYGNTLISPSALGLSIYIVGLTSGSVSPTFSITGTDDITLPANSSINLINPIKAQDIQSNQATSIITYYEA